MGAIVPLIIGWLAITWDYERYVVFVHTRIYSQRWVLGKTNHNQKPLAFCRNGITSTPR
jgi:hypothetical protein